MVKSSGPIEWWLDSDIYSIVLKGKGAKQTVWGATGICRSVGGRRLAVSFFFLCYNQNVASDLQSAVPVSRKLVSLGHECIWRSCLKMSRGWVVSFKPTAALPPKREQHPPRIVGRVGPWAGPDCLEKRWANSVALDGNWTSFCQPFRSWSKPIFTRKPHDKSCGCWRNTSTHS